MYYPEAVKHRLRMLKTFIGLMFVLNSSVIMIVHKLLTFDFFTQYKEQESRAAARKPRDAASVLFGRSSPTTFLTSIRLAMLQKPRFRAPNMLAQNTI